MGRPPRLVRELAVLSSMLGLLLGPDVGRAQAVDGAASEASASEAEADVATDATDAPSAEEEAPPEEALSPEEEERRAAARQRYAQGAEFFRAGRYAPAVAELEEAYRLWENPTILYSLAQAHEGLLDVLASIAAYTRYLMTAPPDDPRRAEVETRIQLLGRLLASLHITSNVPATVYVDDREAGTSPGLVRVPTGAHVVEVRAEGHERARQTITVAGGTDHDLAFELAEVVAEERVVHVTERAAHLPPGAFYAAVGATGAVLVPTAIVGGLLVRDYRAYQSGTLRSNLERREAMRLSQPTNILLGITAGLGLTALVVGLLTDFDDAEDAPAAGAVDVAVAPLPGQGAALLVGGTL